MNILHTLYETNLPKVSILQRKQNIYNPYTIIYGAPKSGKTYLIYDYLEQFDKEQYLYIDINDIRINEDDIYLHLIAFIKEIKLQVLIIDNFNFNFDISKLSSIQNIILSTTNTNNYIENFEIVNLTPLDFEEYILFDNKHQNTINSFNSFLKYGNFCEIIQFHEFKQLYRNQEILQLISNNIIELEILKLLIKSSGELKSIFQLFNTLKKSHKISKDIFYKISKQFESDGIIFFCQKYNQPKALKKVYCYNHALIDAVNINKKFQNIFSNMIFLELNRLYKDIYYIDNVDFYIKQENSIILTIPFFNDYISLSTKILPILEELNINNITIITISTTKNIFIGNIQCEVLPFYEWALTL